MAAPTIPSLNLTYRQIPTTLKIGDRIRIENDQNTFYMSVLREDELLLWKIPETGSLITWFPLPAENPMRVYAIVPLLAAVAGFGCTRTEEHDPKYMVWELTIAVS